MAAETSDIDLGNTYLYHQLDEYPWDEDQEFQGGLRAILGSVQDPAQVDHLTLRAKCYYFARKAGSPVDFDGYKSWVETQRTDSAFNGTSTISKKLEDLQDAVPEDGEGGGSAMGGMSDAVKPAGFAELCDMIAEGKPIPGIKDIPDTILEGRASESSAEKRKKPWEKTESSGASTQRPQWLASE